MSKSKKTEESNFFKFVVNKRTEGSDEVIPLNVCLNLDYVLEAHDDSINGQKFLVIILSEKRDIIKNVEVGTKGKTEPRKATESITYVVENPEDIVRFWETI